MIKLKNLIEVKKDDCGCGCGGCETKVNESVDLPKGMELGKIFTGHGFAFKKESIKGGSLPNKEKDFRKIKKVKAEPDSQKGTSDSTSTFSKHHAGSMGSGDMGQIAEPDTYDWDDSGNKSNTPGHQTKKNKKKRGYEPVEETINEMNYKGFVKYMNDFYGPKGVYPDKKKRTLKMKDIGLAYSVLLKKNPNFEIGYDSTDREMLRDILIKLRKLDPDYSQKKESVNEFSMNPSAVKKMRDEFKKTGELPPHLKKFAKDLKKFKVKHKVKNIVVPGLEWMSDIKESLYNVDQDMKDGKFDAKNPQVLVQGYGVLTLKTLGDALSRKLADLAKRAKKGEIENVNSVLNKSGVLQGYVKAYMDAKKELKSSTMKRKITMYKRSR